MSWTFRCANSRDAARHCAKANDHSPGLVDSLSADAATLADSFCGKQGLLEARNNDQRDNACAELTEALHGEYSSHHRASPFCSGELGRDDRGQRVIYAHQHLHPGC